MDKNISIFINLKIIFLIELLKYIAYINMKLSMSNTKFRKKLLLGYTGITISYVRERIGPLLDLT